MPGKIKVWNIWSDVQADYPEFEPYIQCLIETIGLNEIPLEPSTLQRVFYNDDIPVGAWPKRYDLVTDIYKRRGAYVAFQKDDVTVIVHGFYKNPRKDIICWRAKAYCDPGGKIIDMPIKLVSRDRPHAWCERFTSCFMLDIKQMIQMAQNSEEVNE